MAEPIRWLALGCSVPVNPSKNRVYIWRKLKEYGAEYFKQGVSLSCRTTGKAIPSSNICRQRFWRRGERLPSSR